LVYFLLGNYLSAATLWQERAIPRVRFDRSQRVLVAGQSVVRGDLTRGTSAFLGLPNTITLQANWEYDLALCRLESGSPEDAAEHFTKALTLQPDLPVRPIAAYYLEKMGKPVPPGPKSGTRAAGAVAQKITAPLTSSPLLVPSGSAPPAKTDATKAAPAAPPEPAKSNAPAAPVQKQAATKGSATP
jgi:hypothetical protein